VDTAAVQAIAAAVTPVPGGVGPVTTAQLLRQTVWAAEVALVG
jgi:methylenetetrahydrofolate dehydrogenase (NADP+)/methenyltetrahydrofolate cyclohydrolase